jgi:RimJ/RimL family protein N-acetyltransferase
VNNPIPVDTIEAFARSIAVEARRYGFSQIDFVRLVNALLDVPIADNTYAQLRPESESSSSVTMQVRDFPLISPRLQIRLADPTGDVQLLRRWMKDEYGRHFLLSSSTAQPTEVESLLQNPRNKVGIIIEKSKPVGAVAFLDIDTVQRRAELRKILGEGSARGRGLAEEATRLWITYGGEELGLEKIFVSTLQTHLRNIQLNESIGFRVEGLLLREVRIGHDRYDLLRMGLCYDEYKKLAGHPPA